MTDLLALGLMLAFLAVSLGFVLGAHHLMEE